MDDDDDGSKLFVVPHGGRRKYDGRIDDVDDLLTAILHEERLVVTYSSKRNPHAELEFEPYTLLLYGTGLYVAGYSHRHDKVITLALDGLEEVKRRRGDRFVYPSDYHPSQLVSGAFGLIAGEPCEVRILFQREVARLIRRTEWHPSQSIEEYPDGRLLLTMNVAPTSPELVSFVLGYGADAEVLEPEELRNKVSFALERALAVYA